MGSFKGDLSKWNVSRVTEMMGMFRRAAIFNSDLSKWAVSRVITMEAMFQGAYRFNADLSKWDVSKVVQGAYMFNQAGSYNGGLKFRRPSSDLSKWDVSKVVDMYGMFEHAYSFNGDLSMWNVSSLCKGSSLCTDHMFTGSSCSQCDKVCPGLKAPCQKWCYPARAVPAPTSPLVLI